jgi:hypothetical protein
MILLSSLEGGKSRGTIVRLSLGHSDVTPRDRGSSTRYTLKSMTHPTSNEAPNFKYSLFLHPSFAFFQYDGKNASDDGSAFKFRLKVQFC